MWKFKIAAIAALVMTVVGLSGSPAAASPVVFRPPPADAPPALLVEAKHRHGHYHGHRHHYRYGRNYWPRSYYRPRCYGWYAYDCGPYYGGYYGGIGLGFGTTIILRENRHRHYSSSRHVRWCKNRYRSYNVRSNSWVSYSGRVRKCISPYSR